MANLTSKTLFEGDVHPRCIPPPEGGITPPPVPPKINLFNWRITGEYTPSSIENRNIYIYLATEKALIIFALFDQRFYNFKILVSKKKKKTQPEISHKF